MHQTRTEMRSNARPGHDAYIYHRHISHLGFPEWEIEACAQSIPRCHRHFEYFFDAVVVERIHLLLSTRHHLMSAS